MIVMILKMTGMTTLYVLLTMLLWMRLSGKPLTVPRRILVGVIYGICAVLSTHFGVDYGHMLLNVRDIGPLAAGLFFHPASGIIAGVIGSVERYIAGTYWGVGEYTRIACSVSTFLAGIVAALSHVYLFKREKPSGTYAFFMGAVMEVFHMYVVLITHRGDMDMAFYVVRICAIPMIAFTGLGMAACAIMLKVLSKEWRNPFRRLPSDEVTVSHKFQSWLFGVALAVFVANSALSFAVQTQSAIQYSKEVLADVSKDIVQTHAGIQTTQARMEDMLDSLVLTDTRAIVRAVENAGGPQAVDEAFLESWRELYKLESVSLFSKEGKLICTAGRSPRYAGVMDRLASGAEEVQSSWLSSQRVVVAARCGDCYLQTVLDAGKVSQELNQSGLHDILSMFHVGSTGGFDIVSPAGYSIAGSHKNMVFSEWYIARKHLDAGETFFTDTMFEKKSLCRVEELSDGSMLLALIPLDEVYEDRDIQSYESLLGDILLFTVIYLLITLLVQHIVVNNLQLVNKSLAKITDGDLNETVNVRNASEFAQLSDDINKTVSALKGYIDAAKKRIEEELEFARTIQDAALPKNFDFPRQDFELYAMMDPAREVGGDFYDFFFIDSNRLALVIADVSGKGIPAALFMMRSKTAIRGLASSGSTPSEILYEANNILCEGNDAEMFVTVWIGIVDMRTGDMRCANAGHEYPMLMRAGGDYELYKDKHGLTLAAMENVRFSEYTLKFEPGDRLFVYTDGVPEAINAQEEQYGTDRLTVKLNELRNAPMIQTLPDVRADVEAFAAGEEQFDDITMLGFVYYGADGRQTP